MPYRRRTTFRRRRPMTRKRSYRRKFSSRRVKSRGNQRIYYFKRSTNLAPVVAQSTTTDTIQYYSFRLDDLPDYSELTTLYDQYQIAAVKLSFIPLYNMATLNEGMSGNTAGNSNFNFSIRSASALDYDGAQSGVTGMQDLREYQTYKWKSYPRIHSRYLRPKAIMSYEGVSAAVPYVLPGRSSPWFNTGSATNVTYGGLWFAVDAVNSAPLVGQTLYKVEAKYYLKFKTVK